MITAADRSRWEGDTPIADLTAAGLRKPCLVRLKFFSLDIGLGEEVIGALGEADRKRFQQQFGRYLLGQD